MENAFQMMKERRFVGSFIIWNAFSMQVAQRTRELALFRAIGATRGQVMRTILAEALLLALVASLVGVALGVGLARGLSALMDGFGISIPTAPLRVQASTVVIALVVGYHRHARRRARARPAARPRCCPLKRCATPLLASTGSRSGAWSSVPC
jgi:putative ABC transport system permease protein